VDANWGIDDTIGGRSSGMTQIAAFAEAVEKAIDPAFGVEQ
jgi:hypothetical protein